MPHAREAIRPQAAARRPIEAQRRIGPVENEGPIGRPGIGYQNSNGYDRYLVPGYPTEVNASVFSYPVTVVRAATR